MTVMGASCSQRPTEGFVGKPFIGRRQGRPRLQARDRFQEADNLVGAQNHRQRTLRAGMDNPLRNLGMAQPLVKAVETD